MPSRPLGPHTVYLMPPVLNVDTVGNTTYYTYPDLVEVRNSFFQPFLMTEKFQEEFTNERETTRTFYRVFVPWNSVTELITDEYRITFKGSVYEVHALIGEWSHFSGEQNHIAFLVKRREG